MVSVFSPLVRVGLTLGFNASLTLEYVRNGTAGVQNGHRFGRKQHKLRVTSICILNESKREPCRIIIPSILGQELLFCRR